MVLRKMPIILAIDRRSRLGLDDHFGFPLIVYELQPYFRQASGNVSVVLLIMWPEDFAESAIGVCSFARHV
jgi:hypothetical protein